MLGLESSHASPHFLVADLSFNALFDLYGYSLLVKYSLGSQRHWRQVHSPSLSALAAGLTNHAAAAPSTSSFVLFCLDRANLRSWAVNVPPISNPLVWAVIVPPISNLLVWTFSLTSSTAYLCMGANNSQRSVYRNGSTAYVRVQRIARGCLQDWQRSCLTLISE